MPTPLPAAHILAYAQTLDGGGVERALLRLARGWSENGRRVTLVIGDARGPLAGEVPANADLRILGDSSYRAMRAVAGIARVVGPDVIFCPGNHYTGVAAYLRLRLGRHCPGDRREGVEPARPDRSGARRCRRLSRLAEPASAFPPAFRRHDAGDARRDDRRAAHRAGASQRHSQPAGRQGAGRRAAVVATRAIPARRRPACAAEALGPADRRAAPAGPIPTRSS